MKSDQKSYPQWSEVSVGIGEKPLGAFAKSVKETREDLRRYRLAFPQWVADHSERGLANWISDRVWTHLTNQADSIPGMTMIEKGVLREVTVGLIYRFRVKRHDDDGAVASYPTQTFLEFAEQPSGQLGGLAEVRLMAGYDWNRDLRSIGDAVISLRDGKDNVIWKEPIPEVADQSTGGEGDAPVVTPEQPGPTGPTIDVPSTIGQRTTQKTEEE